MKSTSRHLNSQQPRRACAFAEVACVDESAQQPGRRSRRGYTLVELLIVIVVMGILGAVAVPQIGSAVDERRVAAAAMQIQTDLEWARKHAMSTSNPQTISFNPLLNDYITSLEDPDRAGFPYSVDLSAGVMASQMSAVDFGGDWAVVFDMHGVADSDGSVTVTSGSMQRQILLNGSSGEVTIQD